MFNVGVIDCEVYEDGTSFTGFASCTLPDKTQKTVTVTGAGTGGDLECPISGQYEAMSMPMVFKGYTEGVGRLCEPRRHTIDLRVAEQHEDPVLGTMKIARVKHVMIVIPKTKSGGDVAPASSNNTTVTVSVRYWATYIDGKLIEEFDPVNGINRINGVDYGEPIRKALGK